MDQPHVLCVGDSASDEFIRLLDGQAQIRQGEEGRRLSFPFGEKVPFEYSVTVRAGGNAPNVAVGLTRLGLTTSIAAHIGDDETGSDILQALDQEGVDTHLVVIEKGRASNRNFVLWFGEDRTILVRHEIYAYRWTAPLPGATPRWLYLSTVGSDAPDYYDEIAGWLDSESSVRFAFQPGTFQIAQGTTALGGLYRRADLLICNRREAVEIGGADDGDIGMILRSLHRLGPRVVVVTDGPAGAYASDGDRRFRVPSYPDPFPPKERTGAGDAFSSALVAPLVMGRSLEKALGWAPINAMSVVQKVGSQSGLLNEKQLTDLLGVAPESYRVTPW